MTERQPRTLPSNIKSNPREHVKAITLESGKQLSSSIPISNDDDVVQEDSGSKDGDSKVMEPEKIEGRKKSPPYPARLKQEKVDQQFAISQMPRYAKFLKEILSNKRKSKDLVIVNLNGECSVILQNKLPEKKRDPGSFNVPCVFGNLPISNSLADLGASINLMPYSLFTKLGLVDFMIMDMDSESNVLLILGRPFLATSRAIIDVCDGKLELREGDETVTFDFNNSMRQSLDHDVVFSVDLLDDVEDEHDLSNESVLEQLAFLLANEPGKNPNKFIEIDREGVQKLRPSLEEPPVLELKELPKHLNYA
ncbi:uncharacterized protein LOC125369768 [Ricinus communis]|uniref:uncharacterized protein LOC125369768 n=1 Tax=Ricinus communis TaxID=3988 RepID=UPI00201AA9F8|nr:uncharacterized protein LOC125369768 [Ricinus communis]